MGIEVRENAARSRFEIHADGELAGFMTFQARGAEFTLVHTETEPGFEGHGLASTLIQEVLDTMRERGASVLPRCRFVRAFIEKHPAYLDLVPAEQRATYQLPTG
jgi:predicted GNAT family acetyltransferase